MHNWPAAHRAGVIVLGTVMATGNSVQMNVKINNVQYILFHAIVCKVFFWSGKGSSAAWWYVNYTNITKYMMPNNVLHTYVSLLSSLCSRWASQVFCEPE